MFNLSIRSRTYPTSYELATIVPLYKGKGVKPHMSSYRPISMIPFLSKLFERAIKAQLVSHLNQIQFFSDVQHGFVPGRSTETALCDILEFTLRGCENGNVVLGIFLDVAKAFDCISHPMLLTILSGLGCDDASVEWFSSFLSDRMIRVAGGNLLSSPRILNIGLAQGSVMGPFLFIIYLNVLLKFSNSLSPKLRLISYADDSTILFKTNKQSLVSDLSLLSGFLDQILNCFDFLGLALNVKKTQVLAFCSHRAMMPSDIPEISIRGTKIPFVASASCLGVTLDCNFSWHPHASLLCTRLARITASLHRLRRLGVQTESLLSILRSLFLPVISYCITCWGSSYGSVLHPIAVSYNTALRAIFGLNFRTSVSNLYITNNLLDLNKIFKFHVCCLAFRSIHGLLTPSLSTQILSPSAPLRNDRHLNLPHRPTNSNYVSKSPLNQVVQQWNSLPPSLKIISNFVHFKKSLRDYLLSL